MMWFHVPLSHAYHAHFFTKMGLCFTYCGRSVGAGQRKMIMFDDVEKVPMKCGCCKGRLARPYLIPHELLALRDGRAQEPLPIRRTPVPRRNPNQAEFFGGSNERSS